MTEIKAFFEQIEKIQNDVLSLSGQTPRAKAGTLGKEQIEELTRIVRDNYGRRRLHMVYDDGGCGWPLL